MHPQRMPVLIIIGLLLFSPSACHRPERANPATDTPARPHQASATELIEEFWPDGQPRLRRHVLRKPDGTLLDHGTFTRWYQNGAKEYEAEYLQGQLHGIETAWHANGQKRSEQHYDHGLRHGVRRNWDEQGRLRAEEHYLKDRPHGTWTIWKGDGSIKWQARFQHGQPVP